MTKNSWKEWRRRRSLGWRCRSLESEPQMTKSSKTKRRSQCLRDLEIHMHSSSSSPKQHRTSRRSIGWKEALLAYKYCRLKESPSENTKKFCWKVWEREMIQRSNNTHHHVSPAAVRDVTPENDRSFCPCHSRVVCLLTSSSCHIRIENMSIFHCFPFFSTTSILYILLSWRYCHDDITSLEAVISFSKTFQQKCVHSRLSCHREMDVTYISLFKCPIQKISNDSFNTSVSLFIFFVVVVRRWSILQTLLQSRQTRSQCQLHIWQQHCLYTLKDLYKKPHKKGAVVLKVGHRSYIEVKSNTYSVDTSSL